MGFVGNYALRGLSPQIYDMPIIPKKSCPSGGSPFSINVFFIICLLAEDAAEHTSGLALQSVEKTIFHVVEIHILEKAV